MFRLSSFLQAVGDVPIVCMTECVLIKSLSRRLPVDLLSSYQEQQGDVNQYVVVNYKTCVRAGQNSTAVKIMASVIKCILQFVQPVREG